jgi:hypothetical protein
MKEGIDNKMTECAFPFEELYSLIKEDKLDAAIDIIYDNMLTFDFGPIHIEPDIKKEHHADILSKVDISKCNTTVLLGFIINTQDIRFNPTRIDFYYKAKQHMFDEINGDEHRLKRLLEGLEYTEEEESKFERQEYKVL